MSRSDNSRRGTRAHEDRRVRAWLRSQHDQHERAVARDDLRVEDPERTISSGDCLACGWITGLARCPMCSAEIEVRS